VTYLAPGAFGHREPDFRAIAGTGLPKWTLQVSQEAGGYADRREQEDHVDQAGIVTIIDEAVGRFASRDLIGSSEVVDFLLDLRTAVVSDAALAALIESETEPAH